MGNWAISPYLWKIMFQKIDSSSFGLTYDPSHLIWQFMDPYTPIVDFKEKIFHIHAKDTEILPQVLKEKGTLTDFSWWRHRLPGWGSIDWRKILSLLVEIRYSGAIVIEHEDQVFSGSLEDVCAGLRNAKNHLEWCFGIG
jgi:sugar phosphate isomerase/epimerase